MSKKSSPAKTKLKDRMLEYLSNPSNTFLTSISRVAKAIDIPQERIYNHFNAQQFDELCDEALTVRRQRDVRGREKVDRAVEKAAIGGDVGAQRLFYQHREGFGEKTFHESRHVVVAERIEKGDEAGNPIKKKGKKSVS